MTGCQTNLPQWQLLIQQVRARLDQRRLLLPHQRIDSEETIFKVFLPVWNSI
jgi:hypothetical protein